MEIGGQVTDWMLASVNKESLFDQGLIMSTAEEVWKDTISSVPCRPLTEERQEDADLGADIALTPLAGGEPDGDEAGVTPRRLGRRVCAYSFESTDAEEKKTWVTFWMGTDKCLDLEDSEPLEGGGGLWPGRLKGRLRPW